MACSFYIQKIGDNKKTAIFLNEKVELSDGSVIDDALELISRFIASQGTVNVARKMKILAYNTDNLRIVEREAYRYLWCSCRFGDYGSRSDIFNVKTEKIDYTQKPEQAGMMDYYFCVVIPKDTGEKAQRGMIFYQNNGRRSIKSTFEGYFRDYLNEEDMVLVVSNIAPTSYLLSLLENREMSRIDVIKHSTSSDKADGILGGITSKREERSYIKPVMSGKFLQGIKNIFTGASNNISTFFELEDFNYDEIKVVFTGHSGNKTVNMNNPFDVEITETLSKKLKLADGTIDEEALLAYVVDRIEDYMDTYDITVH